jgi:hypothetical protein
MPFKTAMPTLQHQHQLDLARTLIIIHTYLERGDRDSNFVSNAKLLS